MHRAALFRSPQALSRDSHSLESPRPVESSTKVALPYSYASLKKNFDTKNMIDD